MVTKAFSGFGISRQATAVPKIHTTRKTPRGTAVSTTTETPTEKTATTDVVKKDMSTMDDTGGVSTSAPPHPHENVKAGLAAAMHDAVDKFCSGEMDWEACKAAMEEYAEDHGKYSGDGEKTDEDDTDTEGDGKGEKEEETDEDEMKAVGEMITKAVAEAVAPLTAKIEAIDSDLTAALEALAK
jgi:TATA-binding protein-associated factor Taf7